jgi:hypothetical protein
MHEQVLAPVCFLRLVLPTDATQPTLNLLLFAGGQVLDRLFAELQLADFDAALRRCLLVSVFVLRDHD